MSYVAGIVSGAVLVICVSAFAVIAAVGSAVNRQSRRPSRLHPVEQPTDLPIGVRLVGGRTGAARVRWHCALCGASAETDALSLYGARWHRCRLNDVR